MVTPRTETQRDPGATRRRSCTERGGVKLPAALLQPRRATTSSMCAARLGEGRGAGGGEGSGARGSLQERFAQPSHPTQRLPPQ